MHQHTLITLYQSDQLWIQRCDCGVFHVHLGGTSLRFDQRSFEELISGLGQAMASATLWRFAGTHLKTLGSA